MLRLCQMTQSRQRGVDISPPLDVMSHNVERTQRYVFVTRYVTISIDGI